MLMTCRGCMAGRCSSGTPAAAACNPVRQIPRVAPLSRSPCCSGPAHTLLRSPFMQGRGHHNAPARRTLPPLSAAVAPTPVATAPAAVDSLPAPLPLSEVPLGLQFYKDGSASFRVWAPHASDLQLELAKSLRVTKPVPPSADSSNGSGSDEEVPGPVTVEALGVTTVTLERQGAYWATLLPAGTISNRQPYRLQLTAADGTKLERRDPYARSANYDSNWCYAHNPSTYHWKDTDWTPPTQDQVVIYEMHIGSFTKEGTLKAAAQKLKHVADLGFTMLEVMPCSEFSDPAKWGYSPRQLMALYEDYGTPEDMCAFVDAAHAVGLGVMMDVVLHHGAPDGNNLWDFDGWSEFFNGGIYHENAPDTPWGRQWAFWKSEVVDMVHDACAMWLGEYHMDALRFDSIKDVPIDAVQRVTWQLKQTYPGRLLTAEITPEDPQLMKQYGFDAIWVHSGYFDIIHQHRALGRGHHGGGDWADGWDLAKLRSAMGVHFGFDTPLQCIKYMTGTHDQVGCQHGGAWYQDYALIGGQHRYAVDQFCGGRSDPRALASARLWYSANVGAAGIPLMFMGTEFAQSGWWNSDEHHRLNWGCAEDNIGKGMMTAVKRLHQLRKEHAALRIGWSNCIHEDRANGIMGYERVCEGEARILVIVNAARGFWQKGEYGMWVGGGTSFEQIYSSQDVDCGGDPNFHSNTEVIQVHDGRIYLSIPPQCTLMLKQTA